MKKSQLIKIIKEEITKVISEQKTGWNKNDPDQVDFVADILISRGVDWSGQYTRKEQFLKAQDGKAPGVLDIWFWLISRMQTTGRNARDIIMTDREGKPHMQDTPRGDQVVRAYGVQAWADAQGNNAAIDHIDSVAAAVLNKANDGDPRLGGTAISRGLKLRPGSKTSSEEK
tara:strand:- start:252 stop:767 length:516 start_codon:yes stop_codon:yes gene_type:complete